MMNLVSLLIQSLTVFGFEYRDFENGAPGYIAMCDAYSKKLDCLSTLKLIFEHLIIKRELSGCCVNWGLALAHLIHCFGNKVCIMLTPEPPGRKITVAYQSDGNLFVADIVEYIKGTASIDEISAIPYDEFVAPFGDDVVLLDVDKVEGSFVDLLFKEDLASNTTPEEFLQN